jgi:hypothetical protein
LRRKGLNFLAEQTDDAALAQTLGLSPSLQDQQNQSASPNQRPSTSPETSA